VGGRIRPTGVATIHRKGDNGPVSEIKPNLLGKNCTEIEELLAPLVDRPFRARQVGEWIHRRGIRNFDEMGNIPKALRRELARYFDLSEPVVVEKLSSADQSVKYLLEMSDGARVESVSMLSGSKATFCLSSQTGCSVGCRFCVTGILGPGRNLLPEEMTAQYRQMRRDLPAEIDRVNVVFMGMGEPLLNTENLGRTLEILYERVSPKRITVSTAGIIPGIHWMASLPRRPKLAVSLNAPEQRLREEIMPISRKYPLDELIGVLREFPLKKGRRITFEYVLISGLNDGREHGRRLVRLLHGIPSKINLIPLNEDPRYLPGLHRPEDDAIESFARDLRAAGFVVTIRRSRGQDVTAACGRLKGKL